MHVPGAALGQRSANDRNDSPQSTLRAVGGVRILTRLSRHQFSHKLLLKDDG